MLKADLKEELKKSVLFFDGAMGTMLQARLPAGVLPEILNITDAAFITAIHKQYVACGSDIITANTFGANGIKFSSDNYTVKEVISAAVKNAKAAKARFVALDIGPLGQILQPAGTLPFNEAVALFREQIKAGADAGADLVIIETMSDLYELKAAIIAAKESCNLPVIASMTFETNLRTFMGCDALTAVTFLNSAGVDAIGVNCSRNPFDIAPVVDIFVKYSRVPVLVMPNAGLPVCGTDGATAYSVTPNAFADAMVKYCKKGASVFGGCCGTTPEHIAALTKALKGKIPVKRKPSAICAVTSGTKTVVLDGRISVIGERINPTGKPRLKEAIKNNDTGFIINEAVTQQAAGADILDVNCGLPDIDEAAALSNIVSELQSVIDIPLQIDSANPDAIERAVRLYNGKPLINSVNGTKESMEKIFPVVRKYGAAVIGLTLDENGIPQKAEGRLRIAKKIIETAAGYGIPKEDIIIDCLVLTASAQQAEVFETIKAIRLVEERLKVRTVLGVSNVSFGLPNRPFLNSIFLTAALTAGLDAAIINPLSEEMISALKAFRVLSGNDKGAADYISFFSSDKEIKKAETPVLDTDLYTLISLGQRNAAVEKIKFLFTKHKPLAIIDTYLVPVLEQTGNDYESGKIFLPQLVQAAECAKACFETVKSGIQNESGVLKGKIILATVKGDIHDIGKNIVKVLLQSYGYEIIDLGKDIDGALIAEQAALHQIKLVGLSALMTTTIPAMKTAVEKIRQAVPECKIMVGGAVMSEEYAKLVGADYYAADARAGVKIAEKVFQ